jgi:hypothetical protein
MGAVETAPAGAIDFLQSARDERRRSKLELARPAAVHLNRHARPAGQGQRQRGKPVQAHRDFPFIGEFRAGGEKIVVGDPPPQHKVEISRHIGKPETQAPVSDCPVHKLKLRRGSAGGLDGDRRLPLESRVGLGEEGEAMILIRLRLPPSGRYRLAESLEIDAVREPLADVEQARGTAEREHQSDALPIQADDLRSWRFG